MQYSKINFHFLFFLIFLTSCSSMNVSQEKLYSDDVRSVQASLSSSEISYDSEAIFANAIIYFEFDKSNLTTKSLQTLKSTVNALEENPAIGLTLSGHADERGTREYNLALGQRRAETVAEYLILNGINKSRITVKSYGEEMPAMLGQNEKSYAKNRRVEIN